MLNTSMNACLFISAFNTVSNMLANADTPLKVEEAKVSIVLVRNVLVTFCRIDQAILV